MALADFVQSMPVIETERLRIRPMNASDVPSLKEWTADRSIYAYWGKGPSRADRDPALMFQKPERPTKSFHLGIEERESRKVIGDLWVHLIVNDRMATVAIRLAPSRQGMGYGTEALSEITRFCFERTELRRLCAEVDVRNVASWRMLEKCGYVREGMIRQGKMVNAWCDYYIYGILKTDMAGS